MNSMLDLTIIVPSYNTRDLLRDCLSSIYKTTLHISFEVICLDDNSKDGSADMVEREFPEVILVRNQRNMFYSANNNLGMKMSKARYALLLNSDVIVTKGALQHLVTFMDEHPDADAASPRLLNPDGTNQHFIRSFPSLWVGILQALNWHKLFSESKVMDQYYNTNFDYNKVQTVESVGTTAFIIRRDTWQNYGMLDERFPHHFVDLAYCFMLRENGCKIYYTPGADIIHFGSQSVNQDSRNQIYQLHQALQKFYDFYYGKQASMLERCLTHVGIRLRLYLKLFENSISNDKRVIKGPGAPKI